MGELQKRIEIERTKLKEREATNPSFVAVERRAINMFENWVEEMRLDFYNAIYPYLSKREVTTNLETLFRIEKVYEKWFGKPQK